MADITATIRLLRLFLVSYAPLLLILGIQMFPEAAHFDPTTASSVVLLAVATWGFLDGYRLPRGAAKKGTIRVHLCELEDQGGAVAGYLATYLLPFLAWTPDNWRDIGSGLVYFGVLLLVFLRSDLALVNPTLYVFGWRVVAATRLFTDAPSQRVLVLVPSDEPIPDGSTTDVNAFGRFLIVRARLRNAEMDWNTWQRQGDPLLLVATRKSGKVMPRRVDIHEDAFDALAEIVDGVVADLRNRESREYEPFGELEIDEFFTIDRDTIPERPGDRRKKDPVPQPATAIRMITEADEHEALTADELAALDPKLYAIVYRDGDTNVGFIRKADPLTSLNAGAKYFQYGDTLRFVSDPPNLVLDRKIDLVVDRAEVTILNPYAFQVLFGDVDAALQNVPNYMGSLETQFASSVIKLPPESLKAIETKCANSIRYAMRLHHLVTGRGAELDLTKGPELQASLGLHNLQDLHQNGNFVLAEVNVPDFFDWLEGRLFIDDHTQKGRRADRFSSRGND